MQCHRSGDLVDAMENLEFNEDTGDAGPLCICSLDLSPNGLPWRDKSDRFYFVVLQFAYFWCYCSFLILSEFWCWEFYPITLFGGYIRVVYDILLIHNLIRFLDKKIEHELLCVFYFY